MQDGTDRVNKYRIKAIESDSDSRSIVLQNENGPCALLAITNILVFKDSPMAAHVAAHQSAGLIDESDLQLKLGEIVLSAELKNRDLELLFTFLPKLSEGLDINPRFDGSFADSPELELFKTFGIELVHGWILGAVECEELGIDEETFGKLVHLSYEQALTQAVGDEPNEKLKRFLETYPTQMTASGYLQLSDTLASKGVVALFWNNHFCTLVCHGGRLYSLVTDQGFAKNPTIVWEEVSLKGAGDFFDGTFAETAS